MARLLIISRSLALGMRLTDLHEVEELAADGLEQNLPKVEGYDVLVLDVGDPVLAVNTVNSLREEEQAIPVMLISGYQPEWEQVEAQQVEGVHVVPLPITRQALLRGVAVLLDQDPDLITVDPTGTLPVIEPAPEPLPVIEMGTSDDSPDATVIGITQPVETKKPAKAEAAAAPPVAAKERPGKPAPSSPQSPSSAPAAGKPAKTPGAPAKTASKLPAKAPAKAPADGPADVAAAKAVQQAAAQNRAEKARNTEKAEKAEPAGPPEQPAADQPGPPPPRPNPSPSTGTLGQQIAARRAAGQRMGQGANSLSSGPQHDRNRRPGTPPPPLPKAPPVTPEVIEVEASPVAGLSYSSPLARPFAEQPPTGEFPYEAAPVREPVPPPQVGRPGPWPRPPAPETGSLPLNSSGASAANRRMQRLGDRPRKFQRRPNSPENPPRTPGRGLVTDPLGPRTDPYGFPVSALERRLDAVAASLTGRTDADGEPVLRTAELIRMLHERAGQLYGVSDTSQVLADDLIERASAEAAAVLVPDGAIWRVSGGVGLRPLERRQELAESHWLITEVGSAGRAVLVDDTDIVRQQLAGAPLAAWRHLLAVPVPDVRVIVVLARGEKGGAFTAGDLTAVHTPIRESAVLLAQAIETRRLARALASLREAEPESGR
jgi:CheY-like chemotaxis protein